MEDTQIGDNLSLASQPPLVKSVGIEEHDDESDAVDDYSTSSIFASLSSFLFSDKFSDMTIVCGGREFRAHRVIVCSQSPFFHQALTNGFSETDTGIVNLPEDDPDVLEQFLRFLYTGNYDDGLTVNLGKPSQASLMSPDEVEDELSRVPGVYIPPPTSEEAEEEVLEDDEVYDDQPPDEPVEPEEEYAEFDEAEGHEDDQHLPLPQRLRTLQKESGSLDEAADKLVQELHERQNFFLPVRLYVMADKFDVPSLKLLARDRFYRAAETSWDKVEWFPDVVDEIYSCTPSSDIALREIVSSLVGPNLCHNIQRERMDDVMRKHGDFAVDAIQYMMAADMKW